MTPSVGGIVHYVSYGTPGGEFPSVCRAAVIAEVYPGGSGQAALVVLNPTGMFFNMAYQDEAGHAAGSWHWPEKVD